MRSLIYRFFVLSTLVFQFFPSFSQKSSPFQHTEPANWWVGMAHRSVQIMFHGTDIAHWQVQVAEYPEVRLEKVVRVENPNYLFVYLHIGENARPGTVNLDFFQEKKRVHTEKWPLLAREKAAAEFRGFDNSDVLYLITPDRFANGDPSNDAVAGMPDQPNRADFRGRHGGDIEGIRKNLAYFRDMGFTALWLNPLLENNMKTVSYHGYSTTDFYKVDPRFGSNADYRRLTREAEAMGLKMIMDMIANHIGLEHWWMRDMPTADWINNPKKYVENNHRKQVLQDPYASKADYSRYADGWFVPTMPDLNPRNPLLATYMIQNTIWWIEYLHLAGVRMDTYSYPDMDFMADWTRVVMAEYPNFNIVGEEWYENPAVVAYAQRGKQNPDGYTSALPSLMDFPTQMAMNKALTAKKESFGEGMVGMYSALSLDFLYPDPFRLVTLADNHDMDRIFTQVGEDYALFQMAIGFVLTTRGIPQLFYGTEILMANPGTGEHGVIRSDFPGGWAGDKINAFTGEGLSSQQKNTKEFIQKLLLWRKKSSAVQTGKLLHFVPENGIYVYFRFDEKQRVMVVLNKNDKPIELPLNRFAEGLASSTRMQDVLSGKETTVPTETLSLPNKGLFIYELK